MCFVPSVSTHEAGVSLWLPLPSQRKGGWLLLSLTSQHTNMILHNRCKKTSILCQIGCFTKGEICLCLSLSFFRVIFLKKSQASHIIKNSFRKYSTQSQCCSLGRRIVARQPFFKSLHLILTEPDQHAQQQSSPIKGTPPRTQPWQELLWHPGSTGVRLGGGAPLPLTNPHAELDKKREAFTTRHFVWQWGFFWCFVSVWGSCFVLVFFKMYSWPLLLTPCDCLRFWAKYSEKTNFSLMYNLKCQLLTIALIIIH